MTKARGHIRESTERQGERFGPDAQRAAIRRAAAELGVELDELRGYVDLVSATGRVVRDELARAIADARAGELAILVCYDTSRFARNERLAFAFEDELRQAGARVYYALERIWADDDEQAMPKGTFHVINAEYSRKLSRRIRDGVAAKKARGGYHGGIPWGYRLSADKMRLEPNPETHPSASSRGSSMRPAPSPNRRLRRSSTGASIGSTRAGRGVRSRSTRSTSGSRRASMSRWAASTEAPTPPRSRSSRGIVMVPRR